MRLVWDAIIPHTDFQQQGLIVNTSLSSPSLRRVALLSRSSQEKSTNFSFTKVKAEKSFNTSNSTNTGNSDSGVTDVGDSGSSANSDNNKNNKNNENNENSENSEKTTSVSLVYSLAVLDNRGVAAILDIESVSTSAAKGYSAMEDTTYVLRM